MTNQPSVYVFWDNSNIFIPAQAVAEERDGICCAKDIRIHFGNMYLLALAGRPLQKAVVVGSMPREQKNLWRRLESETGVTPEIYERGHESLKEQGVDQCLQTHMLRACLDEAEPQTAVLLTGDGKGYEEGAGFHADLERMYKKGWGIEVISWDHSCNAALRSWVEDVGVFVRLDDYYNSVTFLDGFRIATWLNLTHRRTAVPTGNRDAAPNPILAQLDSERQRAEKAEAELASLKAKEENKRKYNRRMEKRNILTTKKGRR